MLHAGTETRGGYKCVEGKVSIEGARGMGERRGRERERGGRERREGGRESGCVREKERERERERDEGGIH